MRQCKKKIKNNVSMKKVKLIVILSFILLSFACNTKFEKAGWMYQVDVGMYPNRKKMLNDLTKNNKLKGLTYRELIEKIGPDENYKHGNDTTCIFYSIVTDFGWDIDPVYSKSLVFKFNKDSVVVGYKIEEWKH